MNDDYGDEQLEPEEQAALEEPAEQSEPVELHPCPFCGSKAEIWHAYLADRELEYVHCVKDGCWFNYHPCSEVTTWQRRPVEDGLRAELKQTYAELMTAQEIGTQYQAELAAARARIAELEAEKNKEIKNE